MKKSKKTIDTEISLWKKRYNDSKKALRGAYEEVARDVRKIYRGALK